MGQYLGLAVLSVSPKPKAVQARAASPPQSFLSTLLFFFPDPVPDRPLLGDVLQLPLASHIRN